MADLHALMEDAFIKWNEENFVMLRIQVIVEFLMVLYVIMYAFSGLAYFSMRSSLLSLLDAVSEAVLAYTLGAMQAASFKKPMFPVLALALVSFRSSISSLQKYGTFSELRNVLKLSAVAFINIKHGSKVLRIPFWSFWSLLLLKCFYRVVALRQASKSLWHTRSSEVLQGYMGHDQSNFNPEISCNLENMEGYKYLVYYGSSKQRKGTGHTVSVNDLRSVVTLDKIWQSGMLQPHANGCKMRLLSLAFALSLLLRCRLEGAKLHAVTVLMTRKLICSLISTSNAEKIVFIIEHDLLFLKQYLHTGYPMIFWQGLLSLFFTLILCIAKFGVAAWMSMLTRKEYYPGAAIGDPKVAGKLNSADLTDYIITVVAIGFVLFMELWEGMTYVFSRWTVLLLICNCANYSISAMRQVTEILSRTIYTHSTSASRVQDTGRYDFLQSFTKLKEQHGFLPSVKSLDYSVWKWNLVAYEAVGIELPDARKRFQIVKVALIQALSRSIDIKGNHLQRELPWPSVNGRKGRYWSASLQLPPRCSHVILVWHIATSLCELKLAQDRGIELRSKPGLFSFLQGKKSLADGLQANHTLANCFSQYCAYLLVSKPELLPDPILVTKKVLVDIVQRAQEKLEQCDSLQDRYDTLIPPGATVSGSHDIKLSGNILEQGTMLANELIHNEGEEERWQILAEVWADLLVHIAPSPNPEVHAKNLEFRDELITVVWALLCHCGIEKSKLWPDDSGAEETIQGHLNRNSCAGACVPQMPTPSPPADPGHSQRGDTEEVQDIAAGARAQQVATPAPPAATRDTHGGDIEEVENIEIITETGPTSSPTS